jgi:hypothetical protein
MLAPAHQDAAAEDPSPGRTPSPRRALAGLLAFVLYFVASVSIWGGSAVAHLSTDYIPEQTSADPDFFRWALAWSPWALLHGLNPLFSDAVFAPTGVSLTWATIVPGPALVMWPITAVFGPLAAYNVLVLSAPALAAWAAYLVCHRLTETFWPSLLGGFLFGFSSYVATQMNHPNLSLVFPIPLAVYLLIRRLEGSLRPGSFVALFSLTLVGLWSISIELFATATMFAGIALVIALAFASHDRRHLLRATLLIGIGYAIVGAIVFVPYLLPALRHAPTELLHDPENHYADLLRFAITTTPQLIGGKSFAAFASRHIDARIGSTPFIGVGLLIMLIGFAITERRRRATWALLSFVAVTALFTLGPHLHVAGRTLISLPGAIVSELPLLRQAIPERFIVFTDLAIAVIAALWLSRTRGRYAWMRWVVVVCGAALLIPNVSSLSWHGPDTTPAFFSDGTYATVLTPGETVLMIPEKRGQGMAWQAAADFSFRMPDGYVGPSPQGIPSDPLDRGLSLRGGEVPDPVVLQPWLAEHGVSAIVMADVARPMFETVVRYVDFVPVYEGGGVSVWRPA